MNDQRFNDAFEQSLEHELHNAVATINPDVEAALEQAHRSVDRVGRDAGSRGTHWFLAVAAAVTIVGGGIFAASRFAESPDEIVVGDGGDNSTTVTTVVVEPTVTTSEADLSGQEPTETTGPVTTVVVEPTVTNEDGTPQTTANTEPNVQSFKLLDLGFESTDPNTGELTLVSFGAPRDEVVEIIQRSIGEPLFERSLEQCGRGQTSLVGWGSLSLYIDDDTATVVGWNLGGSGDGPAVVTGTGIEIGSPVSLLRAAYPEVELLEGSLGWEFFNGTAGWYLSGPNDSDIVEASWAGETCVFG